MSTQYLSGRVQEEHPREEIEHVRGTEIILKKRNNAASGNGQPAGNDIV
jgi:hypothetical protein